jgi:hypothetical protein
LLEQVLAKILGGLPQLFSLLLGLRKGFGRLLLRCFTFLPEKSMSGPVLRLRNDGIRLAPGGGQYVGAVGDNGLGLFDLGGQIESDIVEKLPDLFVVDNAAARPTAAGSSFCPKCRLACQNYLNSHIITLYAYANRPKANLLISAAEFRAAACGCVPAALQGTNPKYRLQNGPAA